MEQERLAEDRGTRARRPADLDEGGGRGRTEDGADLAGGVVDARAGAGDAGIQAAQRDGGIRGPHEGVGKPAGIASLFTFATFL